MCPCNVIVRLRMNFNEFTLEITRYSRYRL
jgi:hypothetical protein